MPIWTRRSARTGGALALVTMLVAIAPPGHAVNADGPRAVCTADVFRLCSMEVPQVDRIVACLKKERESLSPACRAIFEAKS